MKVALKNSPPTPLPRAEPVAPEGPEMAQMQPNGENIFDRVGDFLGNLFGGSGGAAAAAPAHRERTSAAEANSGFFPEAVGQNPPGGGNLNTNGNASTANGRPANNSVGQLPDPVIPSVRPDDRWVRNLDEMRRSMPEPQGSRLADQNRDRYGRVVGDQPRDQYGRAIEQNRDRS